MSQKLDYEPPKKSPVPRWPFLLEKWGCIVIALIAMAVAVFIVAMLIHLRGLGNLRGK